MARPEDPIFVVNLSKGLANRRRLPLEHVLSILSEVRQMIVETGRDIQLAHGHQSPDGDFGLELLAGEGGTAFHGGSLESRIAITTDKVNALLAAELVLNTVDGLANRSLAQPESNSTKARIVRRLNKVARIQKDDKIDTRFSLQRPDKEHTKNAVFGEPAISYANTLTEEEFVEESITVFGKLFRLEDPDIEDEGGKDVRGELRQDTGEQWRVQFHDANRADVANAFGEQVALTGTVTYYRVASPKILVGRDGIEIDVGRDYEVAFDELFGCNKDLYGGADLETLLEEIRG